MTSPAFIGSRRWVLLGAFLCAGCSQIHTKTPEGEPILMDEAEFASYFEQVFRHHNTVVNESLFAPPGQHSAPGEAPEQAAEMKMRHACQPLNEAASAAATGETPGFWAKLKLLDAVPECEAATRSLEKLLSTGQ
jgi:hypothetical protein